MTDLPDEWAARVYRFALRLTGDPHDAADLAQEALARAWANRRRLREPQAGRVWLFRIAANLWRDRLRRRSLPAERAGPATGEEPTHAAGPARLAEDREQLARALDALDALPARQREVLYLIACEGMTAAEVADVLDTSREAVKANLSLARKKIREWLPDDDGM